MKKGILIPLDFDLSLSAAVSGREFKLPLADSIIYATAMKHNATLYTMDKHFKSLPNVQFYEK
jgi:predicted nucleic acid-binding protein